MNFLVTGGCGFIGSNLVRRLIEIFPDSEVHNIDKLTYAANNSLDQLADNKNYFFYHEDICNIDLLSDLVLTIKPSIIFHLAAESHVDNSISSPYDFIQTNIIGTFNLLEAAYKLYKQTNPINFKLIHISTDEVFGDLSMDDKPFTEFSRYQPSSPYSSSKASSDHLVKAWNRTYNLPTIVTNCSNNYGPFQDNEKFIPTIINSLKSNLKIPVYGDGLQIRDWLYVDDHADALIEVAKNGIVGSSYVIGGENELSNIELVSKIINIFHNIKVDKRSILDFVDFVSDRPGHDKRYAIDSSKIIEELNWMPKVNVDEGLISTIDWYKNK